MQQRRTLLRRQTRPHLVLVLVLRAVGVVRLQGGEVVALGAGLGAGVQLAQLHKVAVLCHLFTGQIRHHQSLLQGPVTCPVWTADDGFAHLHLKSKSKSLLAVD